MRKSNITFQYHFIAEGSMVSKEERNGKLHFVIRSKKTEESFPTENTVILDVGNQLIDGVIDHHHLKNGVTFNNQKPKSTTAIVKACPSLLKTVCEYADRANTTDRQVPNDVSTDQKSESKITIIVHRSPDFDCFASAYLVQEYIENRSFPEFTDEMVEYANKIDSGEMLLNPEMVISPYTLTLFIGEITRKACKGNPKIMYNQEMMKRGQNLIHYLFIRMKELSPTENSLYSPTILGDDHPLQEEATEVVNDFANYKKDRDNPKVCEVRQMPLPSKNHVNTVSEVDGLFWNTVPTCSLHKLWARIDPESPSGKGFVFTFIPGKVDEENSEEVEVGQSVSISKVTISVNPISDAVLTNMGKYLEYAEVEEEIKQFGKDNVSEWRTREEFRYPEEWCTNGDPWYDGRGHDFTIIESPRTGSLLSTERIKEITIQYTKPMVKKNFSRVLFPFEFNHKEYQKKYKQLQKNKELQRVDFMEQKERVEYFRPYIQKYLFGAGNGIDQEKDEYCCEFSYQQMEDHYLCFKESDQRKIIDLHFFNGSGPIKESRETISKIDNAHIILFKYGIGFLVVDTEIVTEANKDIPMEIVVDTNRALSDDRIGKKRLTTFFEEKINGQIDLSNAEKGLIYTNVLLDPSSYFESSKQEILYKLCSNTSWGLPFQQENKRMKETLEKMFYDYNDYAVYGFSKNGSALMIVDQTDSRTPAYKKKLMKEETEQLMSEFKTVNFDIFLMVLHQRYCLMNFSKQLSKLGTGRYVKEVSYLRDILLEFIVQGWFSQITNDEIGMEKYKKWNEIFETESLHDEVLDQVSTIDDYHKSRFSKRVEVVSALFLPLVTLNVFMGIGFIRIEAFSTFLAPEGGTTLENWLTLGGAVLLTFIPLYIYLMYTKKNRVWLWFKWLFKPKFNRKTVHRKQAIKETNKTYDA
ncbi:hypothetical protein [Evansella tamaricis]|uniref:Uncharacterized protein n=1 Tax=Evansella tamaricis TaxID=2069301 RepID=A0ABS6JG64_9BACI|nr:hypothetical protein [Evansella tamaricis]MBU9712681.1 hypothetical protein [Evansella tamaricis]